MYSRSVSSFCVELSSCRVGGCRVGLHLKQRTEFPSFVAAMLTVRSRTDSLRLFSILGY